MTLDDLDAKFREASWLIAKRSTVAAGQAPIFSAGSLDDAAEQNIKLLKELVIGSRPTTSARRPQTNSSNGAASA